MAPYFRFPEVDGIQQRFWGCRARNPTCGLISLQAGTKIFAWGNILYGAFMTILCALIFMLPLFIGHGHNDAMRQSMEDRLKAKDSSLNDTTVNRVYVLEKMFYMKQSFFLFQAVLFFTFIVSAFWWHVSLKLRKSVNERDLPELKKCFFVMFILVLLLIIPYFAESEVLWSKAFLIDVPIIVFQLMGLIFTHGFIVSLIAPEGGAQDDLNRIQFNV